MENKKSTDKRRIYFIEKSFQARFILRFCTLIVVAGLLTMGILYLFVFRSTTVSIINSRVVVRSTADFLLPLLLQTLLIVTILIGLATIVLTLLFSHKIAGPLYRFKKVIENLEQGDFSQDFHIRLNDQLKDLADKFNSMIGKTRFHIQVLKDNLKNLKEKLNNFSEYDIIEHKRLYFGELKSIIEEIDKLIQHFKS
jgi:methyl-accepting chemotaxis protein